jgi:hypothetical protein
VALGKNEHVGTINRLVYTVIEYGVYKLKARKSRRNMQRVKLLGNLEDTPSVPAAPRHRL